MAGRKVNAGGRRAQEPGRSLGDFGNEVHFLEGGRENVGTDQHVREVDLEELGATAARLADGEVGVLDVLTVAHLRQEERRGLGNARGEVDFLQGTLADAATATGYGLGGVGTP